MSASTSIVPQSGSLTTFFALALGLSWAVWIPAALASYGLFAFPLDPMLSALLGTFGPFCATIITAGIYEGWTGLRATFGRLLVWRAGLQWYLFVLLWPAALSLAKTTLAVMLGADPPAFAQPPFYDFYPLPPELKITSPLIFLPLVFLQQSIVGSAMGEEPGWRGYALPRLQARYSALAASLLLGIVWGVWHLPLWLTRGYLPAGTAIGWDLLGLLASAVLFTWVFNNTGGSLLLVLLFHAAIPVTALFLASAQPPPLAGLILEWGVVLLVIVMFRPQTLARFAWTTALE